MDPKVKDKILNRPRAREIAAEPVREPTLKEMRRELGGDGISDEEMLLRWLLPKDDIATMKASGPVKEYRTERHPLVALIAEFSQRTDNNLIEVNRPGFALKLAR